MIKAFRLDRYKGLYELRTRSKKIMIRIIFYFDPDDNIILLHGFVKKQDRATNQALETARARRLALASKDAEVILRSQGGSL
jgi:phage-related protein